MAEETASENLYPPHWKLPQRDQSLLLSVEDKDINAGFLSTRWDYFGDRSIIAESDYFFGDDGNIESQRQNEGSALSIMPQSDTKMVFELEDFNFDPDDPDYEPVSRIFFDTELFGLGEYSVDSPGDDSVIKYTGFRMEYFEFSSTFIDFPEGSISSTLIPINVLYNSDGVASGFQLYRQLWEEAEESRIEAGGEVYEIEEVEGQDKWIIKRGEEALFEIRAKVDRGMLLAEEEYVKDVAGKGIRKIFRAPININTRRVRNTAFSPNRDPETGELIAPWREISAAYGNPMQTLAGAPFIKELREKLIEKVTASDDSETS